ncbi:hypothetical protein ACFSMZ_08250, partial [Chelativorans composti]
FTPPAAAPCRRFRGLVSHRRSQTISSGLCRLFAIVVLLHGQNHTSRWTRSMGVDQNPRVIRLTAGKVSSVSFAASITRVVRVDISSDAFIAGGAQLREEWFPRLAQLILILREEPSVLRLSYIDQNSERKLATRRVDFLRNTIQKLWQERPGNYRLEIEARILNQLGQGWDDVESISWAIEPF